MNGSEIQIDALLSYSSYPIQQSKVSGHFSSNLQLQEKSSEKKATSKYVVEDNRIVYEKYDQHGKLIIKVPWNNEPIDVTA
jgi:hypothetical protein